MNTINKALDRAHRLTMRGIAGVDRPKGKNSIRPTDKQIAQKTKP